MILSASMKQDIPAFYSEWFMNRIRAGFLDIDTSEGKVGSGGKIVRLPLTSDQIDAIVFWTRNPLPLIPHLNELTARNFYYLFNIGLTGYEKTMEPKIKDKQKILSSFEQIARQIGPERVRWHYDPIMITSHVDISTHIKLFKFLASRVKGYTKEVILSPINYQLPQAALKYIGKAEHNKEDISELINTLASIALENGLTPHLRNDSEILPGISVKRKALISGSEIAAMRGAISHDYTEDVLSESKMNNSLYYDLGVSGACTGACKYCPESLTIQKCGHDPEGTSLFPIKEFVGKTPSAAKLKSGLNYQLSLF